MKYLLAHDLGTSGNKAVLYSEEGTLVKSALAPYPLIVRHSNWAEQDAGDWWRAVCDSTRQLLEGIDPRDIAAVSFSGQMMGCLCVDRNGVPLRNALIWADLRSADQEAAMRQRIDLWDYYRIAGHRISSAYGGYKLMWIRDWEPEIYRQTYRTLNAKDYILYKLTGRFVTEYTDASSTGFWDLCRGRWSWELLDLAGLDPDKMPEALPSTAVCGVVTAQAGAETGRRPGTPVVCGGGDGACAAVGAGSIREGVANSCLGTSSWISLATRQPLDDPSMRNMTWPHIVPGYYLPCGTMQCGGGSYNWFVDELCGVEARQAQESGQSRFDLVQREAEAVPPGARGLLYLPYLIGERSPRWNDKARGAFIGLTLEHSRPEMARAVLEGVALNLNVILQSLQSCGCRPESIVLIGGGAKSALWRQIFADVYRTPIRKPNVLEEATSMGAAVTAGVGVGLFPDFTAVDRFLAIEEELRPNEERALLYDRLKPLFEDCYQQLEPTFAKLHDFATKGA